MEQKDDRESWSQCALQMESFRISRDILLGHHGLHLSD